MNFALLGSMFVEGILSFFSPCILPVLPLYFGYLASGAKTVSEDGKVSYKRLKVFMTTCFFVLGISFAIVIMAITLQSVKSFLNDYSLLFTFIGAFLLIVLGLTQINVIEIKALAIERRFNLPFDVSKMNVLKAFLFGFLFSFSWTPCIGPMLTSALVLCMENSSTGYFYLAAYIIGFVIIFLVMGLFLEEVLNLINSKRYIFKHTQLIGGLIILLMGCYMFYGASQKVLALQNAQTAYIPQQETTVSEETTSGQETVYEGSEPKTDMEMYDFTLKTSKGNTFTLSDCQNEHTIIIFFRTWCTYCKTEIQSLNELRETYPDVNFYLMTSPNTADEQDEAYIDNFLNELGVDIEVIYDEGSRIHGMYGINAFPTTFFFDNDGSIYGYLPGYVPNDGMMEIIDEFLK